jgi:hypothetical protein
MGIAAPPKRSRGGLTSMLAGILALAAAGLAIGGSFAPISSYKNTLEGDVDTTVDGFHAGWWGYTDNGSTGLFEEETSLVGLALVLVAALLVLGAVFAFVASATRSTASTAGGRSLITAGVGVLAGAVLLQGLSVIEQASIYNDQELVAGESLDYAPGLGLILPLAGLALGLIAVVLAHVGQRPKAVRVEPSTPRMGFPAPYGPRPPGAPAPMAERPTDVDLNKPPKQDEPEDDADDTQVISNATASGEGSMSTALSGAAPTDPATAEGATPATPPPAAATSATAEGATPTTPPSTATGSSPASPATAESTTSAAPPTTPHDSPPAAPAPAGGATSATPSATPATAEGATPTTPPPTATGSSPTTPAPAASATSATPPTTPATTEDATPVASPATPATAEGAAAPSTSDTGPTPEPAQPAATPAAETGPTQEPPAPAEDATPPSTPDTGQTPEAPIPPGPTPLTDLPAAPPPPELKKDQ